MILVRSPFARKIVVVGWEGADWTHVQPLLDAGHMPALASLIRTGCSGPIRGFAPWLPPVSWATLATGAHPDRHGIHGAAVFHEDTGRAKVAGTEHRRLPAFWNYLSAHGHSCAVLGWPGTYPAEVLPRGIMVSDAFAHAPLRPDDPWPVPAGAVSPLERAADLAELRLRPQEIDPGLLGLFLPKLNEIDRTLDSRPAWLLQQLSELYTMHNTAVVLCGEGQPDFVAVHYPFIATAQKEFGLFQPPRHTAAGARDCECYGDVVSSAYRLQDALLADLISACEPDTAIVVVSAHGVAHGAGRPACRPRRAAEYAAWCRPHGLLVMKGPGLRTGETIAEAQIEDLAPTLLEWFGLAPGADMHGRAIDEVFISPSTNAPSNNPYEADRWLPAIVLLDPQTTPGATERLLLRLIGQGLVQPHTASDIEAARFLVGQNAFLLGLALSALHRPADALPPLHHAFLAAPESPQRALSLMHGLLRLGLLDEAVAVGQLFLDHGSCDSRHRLMLALKLSRQHPEDTLRLLADVVEPEFAETRRGLERMVFPRLRRHPEMVASFQRSLAVQPDAAELWLGLALAQLTTGAFDAARTSALHARRLDATLPEVTSACEHVETAARTRRVPDTLANPVAMPWSRLMEKAVARQTLRADLRERAENSRIKRTRTRATQNPAWSMSKGGFAATGETGESVLSSADISPSWSVRPPWPDEMPRVQAQFAPALRQTRTTPNWIWVLVADTTERLAGAIVLSGVEDGPTETARAGRRGRVDLDLRETWIDTPAGDALLAVALRHAAATGLASLDLQTRVSEPMNVLLQRHGFGEVICHEVWTARIVDGIACQQAEYGRVLKRWPVQMETFQARQLEIAREICSGTGLLTPEKVVMKSLQHPRGIELATSFVAGPPDQPVAILLSSINGPVAEVEIVARNPASPTAAPAAVPALLLRFLLAAQDLGCLEVRCSMRPEITPTLIALMKKWNGRCQQRQALHRRQLS